MESGLPGQPKDRWNSVWRLVTVEAVWFLSKTTEQLPETRRMTSYFITEVVRTSADDDLRSVGKGLQRIFSR